MRRSRLFGKKIAFGTLSFVALVLVFVFQDTPAPGQAAKAAVKAKDETVKKQVIIRKQAIREVVEGGVMIINNGPQIEQFTKQFRTILRAEYYRVLKICSPTKDQKKAIARDGEKVLKEIATRVSVAQNAPAQVVNGVLHRSLQTDPRREIQTALLESIKAHISDSQANEYQEELAIRTFEEKETTIENLISKIDQNLFLSSDQRQLLKKNLTEGWGNGWSITLFDVLYDDIYYPMMAQDKAVTSVLTPDQRGIWNSAQKINRNTTHSSLVNLGLDLLPLEDAEIEPEDAPDPKN